jgi:hypothetical protein
MRSTKTRSRRSRMTTVLTPPSPAPGPVIVPVFPKKNTELIPDGKGNILTVATTVASAEAVPEAAPSLLSNIVTGSVFGPSIPIIYDATHYDEQYNPGSIQAGESTARADWYLSTYGYLFETTTVLSDSDLPDISTCFGLLIRRKRYESLAWDGFTSMQNDGIYSIFVENVTESCGRLYLLTTTGPVYVTPAQLKERYSTLFM